MTPLLIATFLDSPHQADRDVIFSAIRQLSPSDLGIIEVFGAILRKDKSSTLAVVKQKTRDEIASRGAAHHKQLATRVEPVVTQFLEHVVKSLVSVPNYPLRSRVSQTV